MSTRYKIVVEYDGSPFVGWQRQDNGPSVQGVLERAIAAFSRETVTVTGAGRTDAGVHALGQVAHFDLEKNYPPATVMGAINHFVRPDPVAVVIADVAAADFHARFSATGRRYLYRLLDRRAPPVTTAGRVWHVPHPLDVAAMHAAAQTLLGKHDFTTFRAAECQAKSPVKTLDALNVTRRGDEIWCEVAARSFLHRQVRSMVGTLKLVGEGKWTAADVAAALAACTRSRCGTVAPPEGLYLMSVDYSPAAVDPTPSEA